MRALRSSRSALRVNVGEHSQRARKRAHAAHAPAPVAPCQSPSLLKRVVTRRHATRTLRARVCWTWAALLGRASEHPDRQSCISNTARPNGPRTAALAGGVAKQSEECMAHGARHPAGRRAPVHHGRARSTAPSARRAAHGARRMAYGARCSGTAPGWAPCSCERHIARGRCAAQVRTLCAACSSPWHFALRFPHCAYARAA